MADNGNGKKGITWEAIANKLWIVVILFLGWIYNDLKSANEDMQKDITAIKVDVATLKAKRDDYQDRFQDIGTRLNNLEAKKGPNP